MSKERKPVIFMGTSRRDLKKFPLEVMREVGHALQWVQCGEKPPQAKRLKGFSGSGVLEIIEDYDGDTYRAAYTVRFAEVVYVLHCFQKKSKKGIATPKRDMELIKSRLNVAEKDYQGRIKLKD